MRFLIDTNILIHAAIAQSDHHGVARKFLDGHLAVGTAWCTTWPVLYEFFRVTTHRRIYPKPLSAPTALAFVEALISHPAVTVLSNGPRHLAALADTIGSVIAPSGSIFHDLHTVALMREHGVGEIMTIDTDFHRFAGIKVTNPLARA